MFFQEEILFILPHIFILKIFSWPFGHHAVLLHRTLLQGICNNKVETSYIAWFPQPRKYYFPGHNYYFPAQYIQDLKVISQNICEKTYHIYSMSDWLLTFFYDTASSSLLLLAIWSILFYLTNMGYQDHVLIVFFFYGYNIKYWIHFIHRLFCSKWILFHKAIFFPGHFMILQFSRTFP